MQNNISGSHMCNQYRFIFDKPEIMSIFVNALLCIIILRNNFLMAAHSINTKNSKFELTLHFILDAFSLYVICQIRFVFIDISWYIRDHSKNHQQVQMFANKCMWNLIPWKFSCHFYIIPISIGCKLKLKMQRSGI